MHREVIIIAPTPELFGMPQRYLIREKFWRKNINMLTPTENDLFEQHKSTLLFLKKLEAYPNVHIVNICSPLYVDKKLLLKDNNHLLFTDINHLSYWGSMKLKNAILKQL
jgi:hypothetical protein